MPPGNARCYLALVGTVVCLSAAHSVLAQSARPAERISQGLIQFLASVPSAYSPSLVGIPHYAGDSVAIFVMSARTSIASRFRTARAQRAKFVPSESDLQDVVTVRCGDEDLADRLNCAGLTVTVAGKPVAPLQSRSGPRAFQNAFGVTWTVRLVSASFRAGDVREGFAVTALGENGFSWTLEVSREDAQRELLLRVEDEAIPGL
jgi:hypothetical protein